MKLKFKTKIVTGFACIVLILTFMGGYTSITISNMHRMQNELYRYSRLYYDIADIAYIHEYRLSILARSFLLDTPFTLSLNPDDCEYAVWRRSDAPAMVDDAQIYARIDAIDTPHRIFHIEGGNALTLRDQGRMEEAVVLLNDVVFPAGDESVARLRHLADRYAEIQDEQMANLHGLVATAYTYTSVVVLTGIIAAVFISGLIMRSVHKDLGSVVSLVKDISNGKLSVNIDRDNLLDDDIGKLTNAMYDLTGVIKGMVGDLKRFSHEYIVNGDIDYRIDTTKYTGEYVNLVKGFNEYADVINVEIMTIINTLNEICKGNFNIKLEQMAGKKIVINQTMSTLENCLVSVEEEIERLIDAAAVKGDLAVTINTSKYEGGWCEIMKNLNYLALAVDKPIVEIRDVMTRLGEGHFDRRVEGDYTGDFLSIKNDVNYIVDRLASYVHEIDDSLNAVASGDLTRKTAVNFIGEFEAIGESIDKIGINLHNTISKIDAASEQMLMGTKQISISAMELANGASSQASSVQELTASIDMINQQTKENAANAAEANSLSNKSTENAIEGNDAMQQMLEAMHQINESSNNISRIIKAIQDIAFQTNLLSLNAAVEAVRAGEHGKGFGVVAEEVRSLAERSQKAAKETTELIEDSISRVEFGSNIAESTAEALNVIVSNADDIMKIVGGITISSRDQAEAIEQLSLGLNQISQVVQANSAISEEAAAASEELNSQAEVLQELVSYFKL